MLAACRGPVIAADAAIVGKAAFARCLFDGVVRIPDPPDFESRLRVALRRNRYDFSVRAGACLRPVEHDPARTTFALAWNELLPLAQSTTPDDIALERAIRHVGNAWRANW